MTERIVVADGRPIFRDVPSRAAAGIAVEVDQARTDAQAGRADSSIERHCVRSPRALVHLY